MLVFLFNPLFQTLKKLYTGAVNTCLSVLSLPLLISEAAENQELSPTLSEVNNHPTEL